MDADSSTSPPVRGGVGAEQPHDSAHLHVSGRAYYTDDIPEPRDMLHVAIGMSTEAHARVTGLDLEAVKSARGVASVLTAEDVPGENNVGPVLKDDPIFAPGVVEFVGQSLFAVAAETAMQARRAARLARIGYASLDPVLSIEDAVEKRSFVLPSQRITRGDSKHAVQSARHRLQGRVTLGGQDQFYLEGHVAMAIPRENGDMLVYSSTQHPGEVQILAAHALGKSAKDVVVECRRMGGAFGGKESQPALFAAIAALVARKTRRAAKVRLDRDDDMIMTGKRHDFIIDYDVGFDDQGGIGGIEFTFASRCGMSADLSGAINDRTMFYCDNAHYLDNVDIISHRCKTNTVSNTAFRGFGGPQVMFAIEYVVDEIARYLNKDPLEIRKTNFYGVGERNVTPYQQRIEDNVIHDIVARLESTSGYAARRKEIEAFNADNTRLKRGIALTPVKFGISFTATHLNQAGALVHVYTDGSVHLNHGGTEMGQGLFTKVAQELQIDIDRIKITASDTSKVPNASATAASSGSDLNGKAAEAAARIIKQRLIEFASDHCSVAPEQAVFVDNLVRIGDEVMSFAELARLAHFHRVSLSSTGSYRTPKIHYDRETFSGRPFFYYAHGAAVSEVVIDTLSGENRVLRVDILHDCGRSLNPAIDMGQVEDGFVQGMGWLTSEALWWNPRGELKTHAPSTYKIPVCSDIPADFRVELLESAKNTEDAVYRSKAVGEPPLMLAISVFHATKDAIVTVADYKARPRLNAPATPEEVLRAVEEIRTSH